jgi:PDZ domain-containing protein
MGMRRHSVTRIASLVVLGLVLIGTLCGFVLLHQSDSFVLTPDEAHSANAVVKVANEAPQRGKGGIFYLDVLVHRATVAESWLAGFEDTSTVVPASAFLPPGGNERDEARIDKLDIRDSKSKAAVVALRALGRKVTVQGGGVAIESVNPLARSEGLGAGMVIVGVNGTTIRSLEQLQRLLASHEAGQTVTLQVLDGEKRRTIAARLTTSPQAPGRPLIGIAAAGDVAPKVTLPRRMKVQIDTGNLGGPSAGLAFALEIYDSLTGRRLTQGRRIAVTGTIDLDGTVGIIGGMKQKAIGARRSGAELLVVPQANYADAKRWAGTVPVVGVKTFAEALRAIRASTSSD